MKASKAADTTPILMSACLLGTPCRYDGASAPCESAIAFSQTHEVIPVCPEQLGGLPTPRIPCELQPGGRVLDVQGNERTASFRAGAQAAVRIALEHGCTHAILKSKSPSCGVHQVYDGSFSGTLIAGQGVAAQALAREGIILLDETELV